MSGHTKGPWSAHRFDYHEPGVIYRWSNVTAADGRIVCTFHASLYLHRKDAEISANAHLIEAAPDLLAFAKWVVESDPEGATSPGPLFVRARAAIAKATGSAS